jgi:hypothetical protein
VELGLEPLVPVGRHQEARVAGEGESQVLNHDQVLLEVGVLLPLPRQPPSFLSEEKKINKTKTKNKGNSAFKHSRDKYFQKRKKKTQFLVLLNYNVKEA